MTEKMNSDDYGVQGDAMLLDPPHWLFEIMIGKIPQGCVYGPKCKRNWVLWRLSKYVLEFENVGAVSVRRHTNGKWEKADDWRNLAH